MADEIKTLVKEAEVLRVAREIHGPGCKVTDYRVEKGTTSVQGFMSNVLRVFAQVEVDGTERPTQFIVKRLPTLDNQQQLANETGIFEHEIAFFDLCAPVLRARCPDLPAVRCFGTNPEESIIYMEDLKELGFVAIIRSIPDLKHANFSLDLVKLVVGTLAKFHAASVGIDWLQLYPHLFKLDVFFEKSDIARKMISKTAEIHLLPIVERHFPGDEAIKKSVEWLTTEDFLQKMIGMSKPDPDNMNILCHGDSWANNMMFKLDPATGKALDIKLIDFQIYRIAPNSRDLLYFLYLCTTYDFRAEHELEILQHYTHTFNENCAKLGSKVSLKWDKFYAEYNKSRLFGVQMAISAIPMIYVKGLLPSGDEVLTGKHIDNIFEGDGDSRETIKEFESNKEFRDEILKAILELHALAKEYL